MELETTPAERHDHSNYLGPAVLTIAEQEFEAEVELRGFLQPIDGTYRWNGVVRPDTALSAAIGASKPRGTIRTEHGESPMKVDELDLWGRYRLVGVGSPPFPVATSLEDLGLGENQ